MAYKYKKRVGPTSYNQVKNIACYKAESSLNPFEVNPSSGGNCTWWAWGRFLEVMSVANKSLKWTYGAGNACRFYDIMTMGGLSGGLKPKPGAIICWGYDGSPHGEPGHVAFVEKVNTSGGKVTSIEISQSGWSGGPMSNATLYPGNGKRGTSAYHRGYRNDYFNGFIYNPVDFGNPAGAVSGDAGSSTHDKQWYINKYGTGAEVYFELKGHGYSHKACCAVLGNMQQESGIRVYTGGSYDGNGSEGLCQWTFGRKAKMQSYAAAHSKSGSWKSVDGQVAYLVYELEHSEKSANDVLHNNSLSLEQMTQKFEETFERAGVVNLSARIKYAKEWDAKMSGAGDGEGSSEESVGTIDMRRRIEKLYSSSNYERAYKDKGLKENKEKSDKFKKEVKDIIDNASKFGAITVGSLPEQILSAAVPKETKEKLIKTPSKFSISDSLVQAPFVEIDINGYIIGSYKSKIEEYPNYISRLDIKKINGEINSYTIGLIHQIRPGADPNGIDELLSKVRYNKIKIRYGDCESGSLFKDTEAIITNVVQNRDYAGMRISYTIYATSACNYVTSMKFNFKATVDRPSYVIRDLLYNNSETSNLLLDVFPGMRDRLLVESKNLIPTNDAVISIEAKNNMPILEYINYLVGCMSNITNSIKDVTRNFTDILRNSTYYITYEDDYKNGSYFKISEVQANQSKTAASVNVFDITVGYPDGNDVLNFTIKNNNAWSLLYKNSGPVSEFLYGIDNDGDNTTTVSPNLISSSNILNEMQKNWWTQMTKFPISAQLSMRGLLKPISLMDYINIDVRFYGSQHITSGLYVVTGQQDLLSGSGFSTNLSLVRVGD